MGSAVPGLRLGMRALSNAASRTGMKSSMSTVVPCAAVVIENVRANSIS